MKIIVNWKSNLDRMQVLEWLVSFQKEYPRGPEGIELDLSPSYTEINLVADYLNNWELIDQIGVCAQDVSQYGKGAYTGTINVHQLKSLEVSSTIIGHSERRKNFNETDAEIVKKAQQLLQENIMPIVAVSNQSQVDYLRNEKLLDDQIVIAYEPIESIGNGNPDDPKDVQTFTEQIREKATDRQPLVIYGGSVDAQDVTPYLEETDIEGFLVGTASNRFSTFNDLIHSIQSHSQ